MSRDEVVSVRFTADEAAALRAAAGVSGMNVSEFMRRAALHLFAEPLPAGETIGWPYWSNPAGPAPVGSPIRMIETSDGWLQEGVFWTIPGGLLPGQTLTVNAGGWTP